jgi:hypothetical protein
MLRVAFAVMRSAADGTAHFPRAIATQDRGQTGRG